MKVIEKLKLNKFRPVSIPTPAEYVAKFGLHLCNSGYSGDDDFSGPMSKLSQIESGVDLNNSKLREEDSSSE